MGLTETANFARYVPGQESGHYESFFLRANHPTRPLAFWIRYTIFNPHKAPQQAIGERWAVFFDGETGRKVGVKDEVPISECRFAANRFDVNIGDAELDCGKARGAASTKGSAIQWDLRYAGDAEPLFLLPPRLYEGGFPKAKALVGVPMAGFKGTLAVNEEEVSIEDWVGSQNHNWGSKHTDHYAWGQVAGFDGSSESFFELGTARMKIGPFWTPYMTLMVLRHEGREYRLNSLCQSFRAKASFRYFEWTFSSEDETIAMDGRISASAKDFVGLRYYNPPGGIKHCLNTKIASCRLTIRRKQEKDASLVEILETESRAAFEILTDDRDHGVRIMA
jgi:hypothetical protein